MICIYVWIVKFCRKRGRSVCSITVRTAARGGYSDIVKLREVWKAKVFVMYNAAQDDRDDIIVFYVKHGEDFDTTLLDAVKCSHAQTSRHCIHEDTQLGGATRFATCHRRHVIAKCALNQQ